MPFMAAVTWELMTGFSGKEGLLLQPEGEWLGPLGRRDLFTGQGHHLLSVPSLLLPQASNEPRQNMDFIHHSSLLHHHLLSSPFTYNSWVFLELFSIFPF